MFSEQYIIFVFYLINISETDFKVKLSCDSRFQRAFTACSCVLKVITLVWANPRNYFENAPQLYI